MATSFGIVEEKLFEADFFLEKLNSCVGEFKFQEARFYMSAFIASARSVTFTLQKSLNGLEGFEDWYESKQNFLKNDNLADFFHEARTNSQHQGHYHINVGRLSGDIHEFLFIDGDNSYRNIPKEDIVKAAHRYLTTLLEVIHDCFQAFGHIIDPDKYYSIEAIRARGETVKDIEKELWGYEKLTSFGVSDEDALSYITTEIVLSPIDQLFVKYLAKTKDGKLINE